RSQARAVVVKCALSLANASAFRALGSAVAKSWEVCLPLAPPWAGSDKDSGAGGCETTRSRISRRTVSTSSSIILSPHHLARRFALAIDFIGIISATRVRHAGIEIRDTFEMVQACDPEKQRPVEPIVSVSGRAMDGQ